ncbi:CCR4-NOT transcription complex subunit 3 [Rhynchospora pubera]|uniref:CCR4-NOT transcription complex subunit 3 n=1 Tax=Rhynchospora pubera TaxID=906938 RepID=A0AAV8GQY3_9POAL|nr:CCR4-NOT transcription complex subunit 3 [Rhynchospora pubera]
MGASRKLQGEIDRVLKKVQEGVDVFDSIWNKVYDTENANQKEKFEADLKKEIKKLQRYRDQIKTWIQSSEIKDKKALMDARKQIEREMERFKVCEKETKTKAFSKEGLGQQPKTDPKEKAKAETRDWLNNVVTDLESQIDNFEAEVEGLSIKKGKTRPPRLTHLEKSITRHKAHIKKLESILRLLDNDELSPEQVNDVKDFLEDYVERNQEDFDEFSDVEELYTTLPLEKVEALEDMVSLGPSTLAKGKSSFRAEAVSNRHKVNAPNMPRRTYDKPKGIASVSAKSSVVQAAASTAAPQSPSQEHFEETVSQESNLDIPPRTPPPKAGPAPIPTPATTPLPTSVSPRPLAGGPTAASVVSGPAFSRTASDGGSAAAPPVSANVSVPVKEDDPTSLTGRRPSPAIPVQNRPVQASVPQVAAQPSVMGLGNSGPVGSVPLKNIVANDERTAGGNVTQPLPSPMGNRTMLQQQLNEAGSAGGEAVSLGAKMFPSPTAASGSQWRPQTPGVMFPAQSETGQRRPEIAPDQREKYLQRLQQVQQQQAQQQQQLQQQQGHANMVTMSSNLPAVNQKPFPSTSQAQQNLLMQQANYYQNQGLPYRPFVTPQSHTMSSGQVGVGHGAQGQEGLHTKVDEQPQQPSLTDDISPKGVASSKIINEDDLKSPRPAMGPTGMTEAGQLSRDSDFSPGQPLQSAPTMPPSANLGVIGRRSATPAIPDLGTIGDNLSGTAGNYDQAQSLQLLEAAFYKLPQPKDSERNKSYVPKHPAATPASYPQTQSPTVSNPALWERLAYDSLGTDTLFFAFYYQQNSYQQYLAARELKKNSWRYHRKYNTWFQRHEEPKVTTDEYEKGSYVYFDFHITEDSTGWCQRIKNEFVFEYNYLEDEL